MEEEKEPASQKVVKIKRRQRARVSVRGPDNTDSFHNGERERLERK